MKLTFGTVTLEAKDYFNTADFKEGNAQRVNITLAEKEKTVDEIKDMIESDFTGNFAVETTAGLVKEFAGYTASNVTENVDDTSVRMSILFEKTAV